MSEMLEGGRVIRFGTPHRGAERPRESGTVEAIRVQDDSGFKIILTSEQIEEFCKHSVLAHEIDWSFR